VAFWFEGHVSDVEDEAQKFDRLQSTNPYCDVRALGRRTDAHEMLTSCNLPFFLVGFYIRDARR
jgi:hypothetical protein